MNFMFSRFSIFTKFLVLAGCFFAILAGVLILASNIIIKNSFINRSKLAVGSAIQFETKDLRAEDFSLKDLNHAKEVFNNFYERIKTAEIIRIKVWDYSGKVIFSDDESIIGKRFPDNNEFKEALRGEVVTEIGQKVKPENISEQGYEQLLEVYVPVVFKGENVPSGVIEAYFKLDDVNNRIKETQIILIVTIVAFTLTSFGLLFIVFKMVIYKQVERIHLQAVALDNASDHVIITDPDGVILFANKAAEKLTGYSKSEMIGNRPSLWGKQTPKEFYEKMWNTIKIGKKSFKREITNRHKDGTEYEVEIKISPILDENNNVAFFVGIERDITREKEIDRAKSEFISLASHQLRTPPSIINWYTEMLLAGDVGELNDKQKEYVKEAHRASQRMSEINNELFIVSRLEFGTFSPEPKQVQVAEIAKAQVKKLEPKILEKKLTFTETYADNIPIIKADPEVVAIIFRNLLSNAVSYTPDGGKISLSVDKKESGILITISDTGIGIPQHQQDRVFTKFFRADNVKRVDTDGTGLGLYILKAIVENTGGKIWFESPGRKSQGTTFYVTLPEKEITKQKETAGGKA